MKILRNISRIIFGLTFIFSGFVKGVDPLGSTYKFNDYFTAFGTEWAQSLSFIIAILIAMLELGIGLAFLFNYRIKITSWLGLLFMAFFLPFTFWIDLSNPVSDCGCFGDALVITNWETFYKNIILTVAVLIVFINRYRFKNNFNIVIQNSYITFFLIVFAYLQIHSYHHLPIMDFRPYKINTNIIEGMEVPDDAPVDEYKTEFIYRNKISGKEKKFNENNYPWQDTINWEYSSSKSILIKEGYHPPIQNFTIENNYGEDVSDFYLYEPNNTFILIAYNLDKSNTKNQEEINLLATKVIEEGMNFICLTSSTQNEIDKFVMEYQPPYEFFFCDEITLKTIIRSNPGLLQTMEGIIIDKWHWRDIPEFTKLHI